MKFPASIYFTSNAESLAWLELVVDYISAQCTNSKLWPFIQQIAKDEVALYQSMKGGWNVRIPMTYYPHHGYVCTRFFHAFSRRMGRKSLGDIPIELVDKAFALLANKGMLYELIDDGITWILPVKRYSVNTHFVQYLANNELIYNHLFEFDYIINRYNSSVVKIEVRCGEEVSIGTGWFLDLPANSSDNPNVRLVVTNDHVLEKHSSFRVLTNNETEIKHREFESLLTKTGVDMALIKLADKSSAPDFHLNTDVSLLEDVITIGYPAVPLSQEAYQLVHRGEVNAKIADMWGQDLLIISARTAPGSSGSPVIDDTGRVVGMVARELFEKSTFQEKGITPYSACIPAKTILSALYQSEIHKQWLADCGGKVA